MGAKLPKYEKEEREGTWTLRMSNLMATTFVYKKSICKMELPHGKEFGRKFSIPDCAKSIPKFGKLDYSALFMNKTSCTDGNNLYTLISDT